jgi:hypothetical protein
MGIINISNQRYLMTDPGHCYFGINRSFHIKIHYFHHQISPLIQIILAGMIPRRVDLSCRCSSWLDQPVENRSASTKADKAEIWSALNSFTGCFPAKVISNSDG